MKNTLYRFLICLLLLLSEKTFAHMIPMAFWKSQGMSCPSGGYAYNGNCYYLGATGGDCYTTCASYGGCLLSATNALAKVKLSCKAAVNSFGLNPGSFAGGNNSYAYACAATASVYYYDTGTATTCGAVSASAQRVCACGSGGSTQSGVATVDGYNYRLGTAAASCDTVCASYGGCDLAGTANAASSTTKCDQVLALLDISPAGSAGGTTAAGCGYQSGTGSRYLGSNATTCAATLASTQRVCACLSP